MPDKPATTVDIAQDQAISEVHHYPKKKEKTFFINFFVQFLLVAIVFFAIGFSVGQKKIEIDKKSFVPRITVSNQLPDNNQNVDFSLFWTVFNTLPQKFLEKDSIDGQKMLYGAISGMVRSLGDPYTSFLDPKQNEAVRSEIAGQYEGVGIQIGFNNEKRLVVIAPLKGTPAESAGVLAKDLILKIDDKDTFDMTLPEAVDLIRGTAGTKVKLIFAREKTEGTIEREIERASIDVKSVEVEFKQAKKGEVVIIKVSRFGEKTDSEWDAAVDEVLAKNVKSVIVDMRNNPGGLLTSSVHLASEFISGTVVKQEFADGKVNSLATDHKGKLPKISLVVLVNEGSASAAEIFAGAMKDNKRGQLIGAKTFGKGSVQDVIEFPGGSGLHVTIAKWLTPDGNSIHGEGITPDIEVEIKPEDREAGRDPQLDRALEVI